MASNNSLFDDKEMETKEKKTLYAVNPARMEEAKQYCSHFNVFDLQARCKRIHNVFKKFQLCYDDNGVVKDIFQCKPVSDYLTRTGNITKPLVSNFLSFFLSDSRNFGVYLDTLPTEDLKVWKYSVDHFYISDDTFETITKRKMLKKRKPGYYGSREYDDALYFFSTNSIYNFKNREYTKYAILYPLYHSLAFEFFYPKKNDKILSVSELPNADLYVAADSEAEFNRLFLNVKMLCQAKKLFLSKTGKILQTQVKKAKEQLGINEYFPLSEDKEQAYLRSSLMLLPLTTYFQGGGLSSDKPIHKQLKDVINTVVNKCETLRLLLLSHVKGMKTPIYANINDKTEAILNIVGELPGGWVSTDEILRLLNRVSSNSEFYMFYTVGEFQNLDIENNKTNDIVDFDMLYDELFVPYVKATLFMLNSLGILDVAYTGAKYTDKSYVDPLRYVRLTELGRYVFGQAHEYKPQKAEQKAYYELDPMALLVRVLDKSDPYRIVLEDVAAKAGENRYKVTMSSFLKNCATQEDVKEKMESFKAIMGDNMPKVWQDFFTSLESKFDPMKHLPISRYALYKVNKGDKELLRILVTDEVLKQNIIRAEGCMLLVEKKMLPVVVQRLKHFGYILS